MKIGMIDSSDVIYDVLVIGGGITGLTAAHWAALYGCKVACLEGALFGGLVANIEELEGYPSVQKISGLELAMSMVQNSMDKGVEIIQEAVEKVSLEGDLKVVSTENNSYRARQLIVASGARLKRLGIPGEREFEHRGVSQCASCDGPLFQQKEAVVVGGGDAAVQEALVLANYCRKVTLIHRRDQLRAKRALIQQATSNEKIEFLWNTVVEEIMGNQNVERIRIRNLKEGYDEELPCSGFFAFVGVTPNVEFLPPFLERDEAGFILTDPALETSVQGVFAAGAVRKGFFGQLTNAVGEGTTAAISAFRRLSAPF